MFALKWGENGSVKINTLGSKTRNFREIAKVEVLGQENCEYNLTPEYLEVTCKSVNTEKPVCIKITHTV